MKPAVAAVKRAVYIGGSRGLEDGLHVEHAEFLSAVASPGAQAAMMAYIERTEATGDLPLYDPQAYERALEAGSFGRRSPLWPPPLASYGANWSPNRPRQLPDRWRPCS
jgi:enoyl-CoA hydratase